MIEVFLLMLVAHFLADYPLQGDFLAKAKNRCAPVPGIPFWQALTAHAAIHGGGVGLITGSVWLGVAEFAIHWLIDDAKCRGWITFNQDQAAHILCKAIWVAVIFCA